MNEKIKELSERAGPMQEVLSKISEQTDDKEPRYVKNIGLLDFQLEKFAELIIRECMNAVCDPRTTYLESMTESSAMYTARERIKKHFGVEK